MICRITKNSLGSSQNYQLLNFFIIFGNFLYLCILHRHSQCDSRQFGYQLVHLLYCASQSQDCGPQSSWPQNLELDPSKPASVYWEKVFLQKSNAGEELFPNLKILMRFMLILPFSNVNVERPFGEVQLTKTARRNKLKI